MILFAKGDFYNAGRKITITEKTSYLTRFSDGTSQLTCEIELKKLNYLKYRSTRILNNIQLKKHQKFGC